jgi:AraC family transcriptional regulator
MNLLQHGEKKFQSAPVLATSSGLGWRGVAAELRAHPMCELPPFRSEHLELTVAVQGNADAVVSRRGGGARQQTRVLPGTAWLCPAGVDEDDIAITGALPQILHIYLPGTGTLERATDGAVQGSVVIRYLAGLRDELVNQLCMSMLREAMRPSAGGGVFVEAMGIALMARLVNAYAESGPAAKLFKPARARPAMAAERLDRVIEFMRANIENDISLEAIAGVACLSPFHFSRVFCRMTGMAPHQYLASLRMAHARKLLAGSQLPLADIAAAIRFSNQANFSRAFRRAVGMTPLDYRTRNAAGSRPRSGPGSGSGSGSGSRWNPCDGSPDEAWRKAVGVTPWKA